MPPASVHFPVATQTPGAFEAPVQGPFSSARLARTELAVVKGLLMAKRRKVRVRTRILFELDKDNVQSVLGRK